MFSAEIFGKGTEKFASVQIFKMKTENGKVKVQGVKAREAGDTESRTCRGNENERHGNMPLVGVYSIGLLLLDFCAHNGVGLAIVEDDELTVAEVFLGIGY